MKFLKEGFDEFRKTDWVNSVKEPKSRVVILYWILEAIGSQ